MEGPWDLLAPEVPHVVLPARASNFAWPEKKNRTMHLHALHKKASDTSRPFFLFGYRTQSTRSLGAHIGSAKRRDETCPATSAQ